MPVADLQDRFSFEVDPDTEPADWDLAVARFLLAVVRKRSRSSSAPPAAALDVSVPPEGERQ